MQWYDQWIAVALFALFFLLVLWKGRPPAPVAFDPSKPYQVFCRDYDVEVQSAELDSALGSARNAIPEERIERDLAARSAHHEIPVREATARIRAANSQGELDNTIVSLLVDHSGSMRGHPMLAAAEAVMTASDLLHALGAKQEVLGFTTVRWKGGRSREKWLQSGRPPYPGRLNDVLHIVYCSAGERPHRRRYATMLRQEILKENLDGEAIEWAASRLRERTEDRKFLIVVSDGAPVDDSTLSENGREYLENHLRSVIQEIAQAGDIHLSAIGIGYAVDSYYEQSITVDRPNDLAAAVLQLIEQLLCKPRASA